MRKLRSISLLLIGVAACKAEGTGVEVGRGQGAAATSPSPALEGVGADGKDFDLHRLRGDRVLLIFYRSASCGLCIQQLDDLARDREAYDLLKVKVIAVTTDPPELNRRIIDERELDFPIISVDQGTLTEWGVWEPGERNPHPAAFILDEEGTILYQQIGRTAADRATDAALVFTIRTLDEDRERA